MSVLELAERRDLAPIVRTATTLHRAGVAGPATSVVLALSAVERAAGRGDTAAWVAWQAWRAGRTVDLAHGVTDPRVIELARYVRTEAGRKRYGQPIGSLITNKGRKSRAMTTGQRVARATERRRVTDQKARQAAVRVGDLDRKRAATALARLTQPQLYQVRARARDQGRGVNPGAPMRVGSDRAIAHIDRELARRVDARVRGMDDATLDRSMRRSLERNRLTEFDRYAAELDRRDDAARRRDEQRARSAEQRARARDEAEQRKAAEYERLLDAGYSDEDAVADAYGVSVEKQRRQAALSALRADGFAGRSLTDAARNAYRAEVRNRYLAAEDATNGHMLSNAGRSAGVDPMALFTGPEARARKHASDELKAWWDEHGRPTFDEFVAQLVDDPAGASRIRNARGDFLT